MTLKISRRRLLSLASVPAAIALAPAAWAAQALQVDDDDAIRDMVKRRIDVERRAVGMAVCVVKPDRERFVAWGRARSDDDRQVMSDTLFEIGSITKIFTALLLADMTRRGEVALDDPVARHLPRDFRVPELNGRQITLADLATHTSGLPRWPTFPGTPFSPAWFAAIPRFSVEDFKAWLADVQPEPAARGGWWYSNAGYALLGMALAHRGGQRYEAMLQARVIEPAGLQDTTFQPREVMQRRMAQSHDATLNPLPPMKLGIFAAGGSLLSTPRDLSRFAAAILSGSTTPIAQDQELLLTVRRAAAPWIGGVQALGWEVLDAPGGAFVNKDGVTRGQAASMVFDPDSRVAIMTFSNTHPDLRNSTLSGGGVGAADIARHLLRPQIPLGG
jgi:serine-type D-Ala-D-Ala carboxypeptidase/endopeptidase